MYLNLFKWLFCFFPFLVLSCSNSNKHEIEEEPLSLESQRTKALTKVEVQVIQPQTFKKEIFSLGLLKSRSEVELNFEMEGLVTEVLVEVGTHLKTGQIVAQLEDFTYQNELKTIENDIAIAQSELEAKLISLGYRTGDSIPERILESAKLESGLLGLKIKKELAIYKLEKTKLRAPMSGIVIEVGAQKGNHSSKLGFVAKILDDQQLEVQFPILESELSLIQKGWPIEVRPRFDRSISSNGIISNITPQVREKGTILVYGTLNNPKNQLLDGMKVEVIISEEVPAQLIVPKSAVLDRQSRLVLFTYESGKAAWNYVTIEHENSTAYTISEGLEIGDTVIVTQNFNLSHLEEVEILTVTNE